ncbi:ABC transporter substrate-binding protein [Calidifontibacter sp. DB0510]|uniref:ABC transporter substrate-binding protein n=1 Tax=Metallococcus carri TaxID=1656884 RepID=A0A967EHP1_9MICO|nr:ABC transporter substrate-binding protein [Metallococcus carri]NHN56718.1 ABC transporter substrate-binding protein [Metallococcus carri]
MSRFTSHAGLGAAALTAFLLAGCSISPATVPQQSSGGSTGSGSACPVTPDDKVTGTIKIGYQAIPNGDLVVKDNKWLESCLPKATIKWTQYPSGAAVLQAFGSGSADISLIGSSPATKGMSAPLNKQMSIKVVWIQDVIGKAESLVAKNPAVKTIKDLKGKKIAVPFGSTSHYSLLQALDQAGLNDSDVTLVNLDPDKMPAAWSGSQIDAARVWDPTLTQLLKGGHAVMSSEDTAKAGKPTYDLEAATTSFLSKNAAFMKVWAACQDAAVKQIKSDPGKAADSMAAELGISSADVQKQFSGYTYLPASEQASKNWLGGKLGQDLNSTAGFLLKQGGIDAVSPATTYTGAVDAGPAGAVK